MTPTAGKADYIIEDIAGCGSFQIIMTVLVMLVTNSITAYTLHFMAFGSYNPGWRCNDNRSQEMRTLTAVSPKKLSNDTDLAYPEPTSITFIDRDTLTNRTPDDWNFSDENYRCSVFDKCHDLTFNPDSVTIVTQWFLICDLGWIPSFITSIQMAGILVGNIIAGHCGDRFGRKRTLYSGVGLMVIFNLVSVVSPNWEVYAVFRFVLGLSMGVNISIYLLYVLEFLPVRWRMVVKSLPCWSVNSTLSTLVTMYLKDWRYIQVVTAVVGAIGFLPVIWLPESLRWLEVKEYNTRFDKEANKVIRKNGKTMPSLERHEINENIPVPIQVVDTTVYDFRSLFKKEFRSVTLFLTVPWIVVSVVSNGIFFGIRALKGNFYVNLIIHDIIGIPFALVPMTIPNLIGRKPSTILFSALCGLCFVAAGCFEMFGSEESRLYGVSAFVFAGVMLVDMWWIVLGAITMEVYPTVIRSIGTSWGNCMARIGGIIAPFIIPSNPTYYFISYFIVAGISVVSGIFVLKLPETNKTRLSDVYDARSQEAYSPIGDD